MSVSLDSQALSQRSGQQKAVPVAADLAYASSAAAAVLYQSPRGGQQLLWAMVVFIVGMIIWAAWAQIDEFTRGQGRVIPSQSVQMIQNLEGGIVAEVFVREGQVVERNEALLRLDDVRFSASLRESEVKQMQLQVKAARLQAESTGDVFPAPQGVTGLDKAMVGVEQSLFSARREELLATQKVIAQQKVQKQQELAELRAKAQQLTRSHQLLSKELALTEPLVAQGAVSRVELLRLQRQVNDLSGELQATHLAMPRIDSALSELDEKRAATASAFRSQAQAEFNDIQGQLSRLQASSEALVDQVDRTLVKSPVRGTIKQIFAKTLGGVVQPGMDIVAIVPMEDRLLIETQVRPADIAFLHPGQSAMVKFTAYDFALHGGLLGQVVTISPDTLVDEQGNSFYLVHIETQRAFLGSPQQPLPIIPGMTVNVDILTGKKSVLDYLLKPILKTKQLALRER
ncbi:MAG: HlyD family type I secretion periplasmic adaptor subunit [Cellvibrionaceae bacterium]|nr:HlyD family type I secretion periplasmic adaptor subunit [Cellvibrionaceae bacterium]